MIVRHLRIEKGSNQKVPIKNNLYRILRSIGIIKGWNQKRVKPNIDEIKFVVLKGV